MLHKNKTKEIETCLMVTGREGLGQSLPPMSKKRRVVIKGGDIVVAIPIDCIMLWLERLKVQDVVC